MALRPSFQRALRSVAVRRAGLRAYSVAPHAADKFVVVRGLDSGSAGRTERQLTTNDKCWMRVCLWLCMYGCVGVPAGARGTQHRVQLVAGGRRRDPARRRLPQPELAQAGRARRVREGWYDLMDSSKLTVLFTILLTAALVCAPSAGKQVAVQEVDVHVSFGEFEPVYEQVAEHLSTQPSIFTQDGAVGSFKDDRTRVRVIADSPLVALFAQNLLVRVPTKDPHAARPIVVYVASAGEFKDQAPKAYLLLDKDENDAVFAKVVVTGAANLASIQDAVGLAKKKLIEQTESPSLVLPADVLVKEDKTALVFNATGMQPLLMISSVDVMLMSLCFCSCFPCERHQLGRAVQRAPEHLELGRPDVCVRRCRGGRRQGQQEAGRGHRERRGRPCAVQQPGERAEGCHLRGQVGQRREEDLAVGGRCAAEEGRRGGGQRQVRGAPEGMNGSEWQDGG